MQQTIDRYSVAAFVPLAVLSIAAGLIMAKRSNRSASLAVLTCMSIAAIIAITIGGRMLKLSAWGYRGVYIFWLTDSESWRNLVHFDQASLLNVALFVPAGVLVTWLTQRMWASVIGLVFLSLMIEMVQRAWLLGAPDVRDTFANAIGAAVGSVGIVMVNHSRSPSDVAEHNT